MFEAKVGLSLLMLLASAGFGASNDWSVGKSRICLVTASESIHEFNAAIERLERKYGLDIVFAFPPYAAIGYVSDLVKGTLERDHIVQVIADFGNTEDVLRSDLPAAVSAKLSTAWQVFRDPEGYSQAEMESGRKELPEPPLHDIVSTDSECRAETWDKLTSEYLIGKIALGIFLMESNGHEEDWSNGPPNRPQSVWEKIIIGLNWMFEQAQGRDANIEFWFDNGGYYEAVPTQYEPITMDSDDDGDWIKDAMSYVGYNSGGHKDRLYTYLNDLRGSLHTDWANAVFVVDDWNDEDNEFPDGRCAYAQTWTQWTIGGGYVLMHGGPYLVMTYSNDGWHHYRMPEVFCHELAHIFGCPDEYPTDPWWDWTCHEGPSPPGFPTCHDDYGYLFTPNYNCEACHADVDPCIMRHPDLNADMCEWTYRHLGWYDSDGDDVPDPINPNSGKIGWIYDIAPGDELLIFDLGPAFIKRLNITEENSAMWYGDLLSIWDMTNWNGQIVEPQLFIAVKNGGDPYLLPGYTPGPFLIAFSEPYVDGHTLMCSLSDSSALAYVRIEILDPSGQQALYPVRDELFTPHETIDIDLSALPYNDSYTARCFGWLPDGSVSVIYEYVFASEGPLSPVTEVESSHDYYEVKIKISWVDYNSIEDGFAIERKDANIGVWFPLDTVGPGDGQLCYHDYSIIGSETHTYRVRPFTINGQDGPWSEELSVKAWPMPPENVQCEVLPGIRCCPIRPSNKIRVTWNAPQNQLYPIDHYVVKRCRPSTWMCDKFEPIYDTEIEICPNPSGQNRDFHVYSFDSDGDSSIVWHYCGACAGYEGACPERVMKEETETELIPAEFALRQNYPNPFNISTTISYDLPENEDVRIEVIDMLGRNVTLLLDGHQEAGSHSVTWNGSNASGDLVSTGVYFYRITAGSRVSTKRMLLLK